LLRLPGGVKLASALSHTLTPIANGAWPADGRWWGGGWRGRRRGGL